VAVEGKELIEQVLEGHASDGPKSGNGSTSRCRCRRG
jgi:hypothetical protein